MRVVIAEDSLLLRAGIARLLQDEGFDVVGQAGDGEELIRKVRAHRPDVALIDIRMPPAHSDEGLRAARAIRAQLPDVGLLLLSQHVETRYASELLQGGAEGIGYLLKDRIAELDRFTAAVRQVGTGGTVLDPEVVAHLLGRRQSTDPLATLTRREREVLQRIAVGESNRAIASRLYVSQRAIERHITAIFAKLRLPASGEADRRVLAALTYLRGPLTSSDVPS